MEKAFLLKLYLIYWLLLFSSRYSVAEGSNRGDSDSEEMGLLSGFEGRGNEEDSGF